MSRTLVNRRGEVPASPITVVETAHGRLRRKQRGIDMKDLQAALMYVSRQSSHPRPNGDPTAVHRYNDIVFVVNERTGEEVTCYARPLQLDCVQISRTAFLTHERAASRIPRNRACWTSNTVIVVDTSGSMREGDVRGVRSRLGAVWVSIALDFLAPRLKSGDACPTDVLSIITMEEEPRIVVDEEPCTWVLYNKLVSLYSDNSVPAQGRGPFFPSLKFAQELLTRNPSASCATSLTLLSDGVPSDYALGKNTTNEEWHRLIVEQVETLSKKFGRRLTFTTIAIGGTEDFRLLKRMADAASAFGAKASFMLPSLTLSALDRFQGEGKTTNSGSLKNDFWICRRDKVVRLVCNDNVNRLLHYENVNKEVFFDEAPLQHRSAYFVAFSKVAFSEGAGRLAHHFYELSDDGKSVVGKALVAKGSRKSLDAEQSAHTFCATQQTAGQMAAQFNKKLDDTHLVDQATPRIVFLDCSVYQLHGNDFRTASVLVEERLDHTKWHKWNNNNEFVEGMKHLGIIEEEEDEDECDKVDVAKANAQPIAPKIFTASEVAQAFSHFSYLASGRTRLVCDLQGVYDEKARILRLSDPAIHYHNPKCADRRRVHGNTDRGRKGVAMFFETHHDHCGRLCKLVLRGLRPSRRRAG